MRIIAGRAGGLTLHVPKETTRPTTDRVRESLFSSLGQLIEGAQVLDLFAGSGALGIESLSRGAENAVFVDQSRQACQVIRKNLAKTSFDAEGNAKVYNQTSDTYLRNASNSGARFDVIFADPPYGKQEAAKQLIEKFFASENLQQVIKPDGLLVFESYAREALPASSSDAWVTHNSRQYGDTLITYFSKADVN